MYVRNINIKKRINNHKIKFVTLGIELYIYKSFGFVSKFLIVAIFT